MESTEKTTTQPQTAAAETKPAKETTNAKKTTTKPKELKYHVYNKPGQPVEMVVSETDIKKVPKGWEVIYSGTHEECAKFAGR